MSDLDLSALRASSLASRDFALAGESIAAGDLLYRDEFDGYRLKRATANTSAEAAAIVGLAEHAAEREDYLSFLTRDPCLDTGTAIAPATIYVLSYNVGKARALVDQGAGRFLSGIGVGISESHLNFNPTPGRTLTPVEDPEEPPGEPPGGGGHEN